MSDPYLPERDSSPAENTPWGFRITLVLAAVYLGWRLVQGVVWVLEHLF